MERPSFVAELDRHVVICNCNEKVKRIVEELQGPTVVDPPDVVLVYNERSRLWQRNSHWHPAEDRPRGELKDGSGPPRFAAVAGQVTSAEDLKEVGIHRARAAVILADPTLGELADARSTLAAIAIERENPHVQTIMELIASVNRVHLEATEINEVICGGEVAEKLIAQSCITPGVKNIFSRLLATDLATEQIYLPALPTKVEGIAYGNLQLALIEAEAPFLLFGFVRKLTGDSERKKASNLYVLNPAKGRDPGARTHLQQTDRLVVIAKRRPEIEAFLPD